MKDRLNLGCGTDIKEGYLNLDSFKFKGVDTVWDINKTPFPFKDNTFSEILISHVLEHVDDVVKTLGEMWRISKKGAKIRILVPYFSGLNAITDPTHKHFFCTATFDFFEKNKSSDYFKKSSRLNFKVIRKRIVYSNNKILRILNPLINLNQKMYERFFAYILPAQVLEVDMLVVK